LEIWQEAREIAQDIHKMTINKLPKFELYEEGSQIRRSINSVKSNIVEVMAGEDINRSSSDS
jgi:four helix bundle protein